jgi:hypothetical protein
VYAVHPGWWILGDSISYLHDALQLRPQEVEFERLFTAFAAAAAVSPQTVGDMLHTGDQG